MIKKQEKIRLFQNNFLLTKEEVLESLESFEQHYQYEDEEENSQERREALLQLIRRFRAAVEEFRFPTISKNWWHFQYILNHRGLTLYLAYCETLEIGTDGSIKESTMGQLMPLLTVPCNYLTVEEYASYYQVKATTVRQWIRRGKIRSALKAGREWLIPDIVDRPHRGYEPVTYSWSRLTEELEEQFPFLKEGTSVYLYQDRADRTVYRCLIKNNGQEILRRITLTQQEREKMELALIGDSGVEAEELSECIMFVPDKKKDIWIEGGKKMEKDEFELYLSSMQEMKEQRLEFQTSNRFYDEDGIHIWSFDSALLSHDYGEDDENDEETEEIRVTVNGGIVIPEEIRFCGVEDEIIEYSSVWELCDAISGDLMAAYETVAEEGEGLKDEIIKELDLEEEYAVESSILFIEDITAKSTEDLRLFLRLFRVFAEGLPAKYSRVAMVLLHMEREKDSIRIFSECEWKIRKLDGEAVLAYRRI